MYRTFRDKQDACIKVVMKPGVPTVLRPSLDFSATVIIYGQIIPTREDHQEQAHRPE